MKTAVAEPWRELRELTPEALGALVISLRAQLACQYEQIVVLKGQVTALQTEVQDLRIRLTQDSSNSSRSPSSDPPQAAAKNKAKRKRSSTGRKRGGQPDHPGRFRALLEPEQVDDIVVVTPEACVHCG